MRHGDLLVAQTPSREIWFVRERSSRRTSAETVRSRDPPWFLQPGWQTVPQSEARSLLMSRRVRSTSSPICSTSSDRAVPAEFPTPLCSVLKSASISENAHEANAARQQKQIEALNAAVQKVNAQLELNQPAPRTVLNDQ